MLKTYAYDLVAAERKITAIASSMGSIALIQTMAPPGRPDPADILNLEKLETEIEDGLKTLLSLSRELGLRSAYTQFERIASEIQYYKNDIGKVSRELRDATRRIEDDLKPVHFLFVPLSKLEFYDKPYFGESIEARFQNAREDIQEAGRCFAVGSYGGVFLHCMGIVQAALEELAAHLRVKIDIQIDDWNSIITKIEGGISRKKAKVLGTGTPSQRQKSRWSKLEPFYSDVVGEVRAIKNAWRNPGFHFRRRDFDERRAKEILDRIGAFLHTLEGNLPKRNPLVR